MADSYTLQYDAQGRPYYQFPGQPKRYVSPVAMGGQTPEDTTGMLKSRPQWNQRTGKWETPVDFGNIATIATAGALTGGIANAALAGAPAAAAPSAAYSVGGVPTGGLFAPAGGLVGTTAATGATAAGTGAPIVAAAAPSLAGTLLKYGLQYALPVAGNLISGKMNINAQRESDAAMMGYYDKALEAEKEERDYRRGFDEEGRRYDREFGEEGRRYGRYSDSYGRESDEERLWYDRAQNIRDKNYGYQQYGNFVETLEPYRAGGSAAASRMSQLMGGPATADTGSYLNLANTARNAVQAVPNVPNRPTWNYTGSGQTAGAGNDQPLNNPNPGTRVPTGGGIDTNLPPGVPPGSVPINGGINPNAWAYQTPDGRIIRGSRGDNRIGQAPQPVSTSMPVGGNPQLVRVQAPDGEIRELPRSQADVAVKLGARVV